MTFEAVFGVLFSLLAGKEELSAKLVIGFLLAFTAFIISETRLDFLKRKKAPPA
jgi:hypothetical protein